MTVYIPWGLIALFIVFYFSYSHNRRTRLRRQERKENLEYRNQELLDYLRRSKKKTKENNQSDKKEAAE